MICGIDPGLKGAIAFLYDDDELFTFVMPTTVMVMKNGKKRKEVDGFKLDAILEEMKPATVVIEHVNAMPGQGVVSVWSFGQAYGAALHVSQAYGVEPIKVRPQKWKKKFGLSNNKEKSRQLAIELFPKAAHQFKRKMDEGRAEAALIALFSRDENR